MFGFAVNLFSSLKGNKETIYLVQANKSKLIDTIPVFVASYFVATKTDLHLGGTSVFSHSSLCWLPGN